MRIEENKTFKFASVWLTNDEKDDPQIRENLRVIMEGYRKKKYRFVIYESGNRSLLEVTQDLLSHNKDISV